MPREEYEQDQQMLLFTQISLQTPAIFYSGDFWIPFCKYTDLSKLEQGALMPSCSKLGKEEYGKAWVHRGTVRLQRNNLRLAAATVQSSIMALLQEINPHRAEKLCK